MATCHTTGCTNYAEPNPADTENGPRASDLDPVYCYDCTEQAWLDYRDCMNALTALGFDLDYLYNTPGMGN